MKVLLVSYWFPPTNTMAALRIGKFAKFLDAGGHDVRVLTALSAGDPSLAVELPEHRVIRTAYREAGRFLGCVAHAVRRTARLVQPGRGATAAPGGTANPAAPPASAATGIRRHYYALIRMPDGHAGWRLHALAAGRRLLPGWRPDIILASAPPFTSLLVARRLSREFGVPWVAEFRDLWVDDPYYEEPGWRRPIDRLVERRVLRSAAALVAVTPTSAAVLERRYRRPVTTILNGYAEEDLTAPAPPARSDTVSIVYTGAIYTGFRDPSPLFAAMALLGDRRRHVEALFYGPGEDQVMPGAARHGVADRVFVRPRVAYRCSLKIQAAADVLLLMQWNDPRDAGNIPGKFFEYLGARRPILLLGYERGILARMIGERGAGVVANAPQRIAQVLEAWIAQRPAGIPPLPASVLSGLSRAEQYRAYEALLADLVREAGRRGGAAAAMRRQAAADPHL